MNGTPFSYIESSKSVLPLKHLQVGANQLVNMGNVDKIYGAGLPHGALSPKI